MSLYYVKKEVVLNLLKNKLKDFDLTNFNSHFLYEVIEGKNDNKNKDLVYAANLLNLKFKENLVKNTTYSMKLNFNKNNELINGTKSMLILYFLLTNFMSLEPVFEISDEDIKNFNPKDIFETDNNTLMTLDNIEDYKFNIFNKSKEELLDEINIDDEIERLILLLENNYILNNSNIISNISDTKKLIQSKTLLLNEIEKLNDDEAIHKLKDFGFMFYIIVSEIIEKITLRNIGDENLSKENIERLNALIKKQEIMVEYLKKNDYLDLYNSVSQGKKFFMYALAFSSFNGIYKLSEDFKNIYTILDKIYEENFKEEIISLLYADGRLSYVDKDDSKNQDGVIIDNMKILFSKYLKNQYNSFPKPQIINALRCLASNKRYLLNSFSTYLNNLRYEMRNDFLKNFISLSKKSYYNYVIEKTASGEPMFMQEKIFRTIVRMIDDLNDFEKVIKIKQPMSVYLTYSYVESKNILELYIKDEKRFANFINSLPVEDNTSKEVIITRFNMIKNILEQKSVMDLFRNNILNIDSNYWRKDASKIKKAIFCDFFNLFLDKSGRKVTETFADNDVYKKIFSLKSVRCETNNNTVVLDIANKELCYFSNCLNDSFIKERISENKDIVLYLIKSMFNKEAVDSQYLEGINELWFKYSYLFSNEEKLSVITNFNYKLLLKDEVFFDYFLNNYKHCFNFLEKEMFDEKDKNFLELSEKLKEMLKRFICSDKFNVLDEEVRVSLLKDFGLFLHPKSNSYYYEEDSIVETNLTKDNIKNILLFAKKHNIAVSLIVDDNKDEVLSEIILTVGDNQSVNMAIGNYWHGLSQHYSESRKVLELLNNNYSYNLNVYEFDYLMKGTFDSYLKHSFQGVAMNELLEKSKGFFSIDEMEKIRDEITKNFKENSNGRDLYDSDLTFRLKHECDLRDKMDKNSNSKIFTTYQKKKI